VTEKAGNRGFLVLLIADAEFPAQPIGGLSATPDPPTVDRQMMKVALCGAADYAAWG